MKESGNLLAEGMHEYSVSPTSGLTRSPYPVLTQGVFALGRHSHSDQKQTVGEAVREY